MKLKYKIIDNFLDKEDFITLKNSIINEEFSWYFQDLINANHGKNDSTCYFTHLIYEHTPNSPIYSIVFDLFFNKLKMKSLLRIKCNCFPSTEKVRINKKHCDYTFKNNGAVFSLNTCDGFTSLEDGTKIDSIENRLLLFDANKPHASSTCTNAKARFNINFNYF